ncbi:MAG: PTS sugar transporter subunit IIA [Alphaproteobacteria bacterium]
MSQKTNMINADLIIPSLPATSKKQAFRALAEATVGLFPGDPEKVFTALMDRERIGSTGIGCGVAIPHIKLGHVDRLYGVLARLEKPVDYDAVDGEAVDLIFMLVAPAENKTTQHLKMLAHVSRFLKDDETCQRLRACNQRDAIETLLNEWLKEQAA